MKWSLVVFVASIIIGYNLYDGFDPSKLQGKNVVITGASEGIGEQAAYHYARMGARILITSRTESNLKKVVERCKQEGSKDGLYLYHVADMMDPDAGSQLIQAANEKLGGIDYLVLNHLLVKPMNPWKSTKENLTLLEDIMKVNFFAYVRTASSAMDSLRKSRGSLIVVSSVVGKMPQPALASYSASKFALDGFFGSWRQELYHEKVDVSITICYISLIETRTAIEQLQNFRNGILLKNVYTGSPSDAAYAIVRGGALRQRDVYYLYSYGRLATLMYQMFPSVMEYFAAQVYSE